VKLVALILYLTLPLQDSQLATVRTTLMSLREHYDEHRQTRGAAADLTVAKHQLRDWVESRLTTFAETGDTAALSQQLRDEVNAAQLYCLDEDQDCFENSLGYLDDLEVNREAEFLIVKTAVGIFCAFDYSAYVYVWKSGSWQRVWENELNTYTEKDYAPQIIHAVHISPPDKDGNRLLLTIGSRSGCIPAYIPVYYRAWQVSADYTTAKALIDGKETALDGYPPIQGRVGTDDVLLEFTVGGIGYGDSHKAVRHFQVRDQRAQQVDPVATTPRDFVEEWISAEWTQSGLRSASPGLKQRHAKVHRTDGMGDFPDPAMRCKGSPEIWQIGTHWHEGPKTYYLVRWRPPYNFTMIDIKDRPSPDCTVPDPKGDEHPALFN
jgi:hypothetical protein